MPIGFGDLSLSTVGLATHLKKLNNNAIEKEETLMNRCIKDLLIEVELQETFNKGLAR